jgi:hypothetical protein
MVNRKKMTHEEHVELAQAMSCIMPALQHALITAGNKLGVTSKACKRLNKAIVKYNEARSALDDEYHKVTSNSQFTDRGHVYYETRTSSRPSSQQLSGDAS